MAPRSLPRSGSPPDTDPVGWARTGSAETALGSSTSDPNFGLPGPAPRRGCPCWPAPVVARVVRVCFPVLVRAARGRVAPALIGGGPRASARGCRFAQHKPWPPLRLLRQGMTPPSAPARPSAWSAHRPEFRPAGLPPARTPPLCAANRYRTRLPLPVAASLRFLWPAGCRPPSLRAYPTPPRIRYPSWRTCTRDTYPTSPEGYYTLYLAVPGDAPRGCYKSRRFLVAFSLPQV